MIRNEIISIDGHHVDSFQRKIIHVRGFFYLDLTFANDVARAEVREFPTIDAYQLFVWIKIK